MRFFLFFFEIPSRNTISNWNRIKVSPKVSGFSAALFSWCGTITAVVINHGRVLGKWKAKTNRTCNVNCEYNGGKKWGVIDSGAEESDTCVYFLLAALIYLCLVSRWGSRFTVGLEYNANHCLSSELFFGWLNIKGSYFDHCFNLIRCLASKLSCTAALWCVRALCRTPKLWKILTDRNIWKSSNLCWR